MSHRAKCSFASRRAGEVWDLLGWQSSSRVTSLMHARKPNNQTVVEDLTAVRFTISTTHAITPVMLLLLMLLLRNYHRRVCGSQAAMSTIVRHVIATDRPPFRAAQSKFRWAYSDR